MITFILFITCAKVKIIDQSSVPWTHQDEVILKRAAKVCSTDPRYTDTPCLSTFYKRADREYAVVCSPAKGRN